MSLNQPNSLLLNRSVQQQHTNRYLNASLNPPTTTNTNATNSLSNSSMLNLPTGRKIPKSVNISSSLTPSALAASSTPINSYQYNQYNSNSYSSSNNQSNYPSSMIKNHSTPSFGNSNRKFSTDYQAAVRFDYSDAFVNNHNIEFLTRVSQMQRLQIDTVDWERKKKQSRKKITKALNGNGNSVNGKDEQ